MENNQKGICINIGNCKQADNKIVQEVPVTADFVCSECGRDLFRVEKKNKLKIKKLLLIIIPIIILLLAGGGYAWYHYSKAKAVSSSTKTDIDSAPGMIVDNTDSIVVDNKSGDMKGVEKDSDKNGKGGIVKNTPHKTEMQNSTPINVKDSKYNRVLSSGSTNIIIGKTLSGIINSNLSFSQRLAKADEAMKNVFSTDLVVETYINKSGVASHLWDKGHGKDYLEHLAIEKTILRFKILAHEGSIPNITYLQLIEIHKQ